CRTSENITVIKDRLMARFELSEPQAEAIAQMRLYQLSNMERQKILDELDELHKKIADLQDILANEKRVLEIISNDLEDIKKKYGDERKTDIENVSGEVDIEDLIPEEDCVLALTDKGYIKRQSVSDYKTQRRGGKGVSAIKQREEDFVQEMFIAASKDDVLFITNKGIMYKLKCYEVPEGSKASKGTNVINLLPLSEDEKIEAMIRTADYDEGKYIVMVTKNGIIKRTPLYMYKNVRKMGLRAIGLRDGDEIEGVRMTEGTDQLMVATKGGYIIRIDENDIRPMSRTAAGVKAIKLREGDHVISMAKVREGASVLTVTENGYGRRVDLDEYRIQHRGGYGLKNYRVNEKVGNVCGIKIVDEEDDVILIASDGLIIRILASDVRIMGRYSTGVRVMRVNGDVKVVTFTRTAHEEDAEVEKVDDTIIEDEPIDIEKELLEEEENEIISEQELEEETEDIDDTEESEDE
ncbi:MAG: DNA gyrase subunit A, partial [Oscillospiraceae bacterium]|nr:DNA gyrase subunit A [Oscillospiraceae bacterium]